MCRSLSPSIYLGRGNANICRTVSPTDRGRLHDWSTKCVKALARRGAAVRDLDMFRPPDSVPNANWGKKLEKAG